MSLLGRPGRRTNVGLLVLLVTALATGMLAYGIGSPTPARVVAVLHGAAGLGLLLLVPWKSVIVGRARSRPAGAHAVGGSGLSLAALLALSVLAGVVQSTTGYHYLGGLTPLQVHVGAALLAVPLLVVHVRAHPQRPRRTDLSRRGLLRAGTLAAGAGLTYLAAEGSAAALGLPGARRRQTGSSEVGSFSPDRMPVTQWFTDPVPAVDPGRWRLLVRDDAVERVFTYPELLALPAAHVVATLDCTGGWYADQHWTGVPLDQVLAAALGGADRLGHGPAERCVEVVSVTGYRRRFPLGDAGRLLLATAAGGVPLSAGHGAPVRLVAPGRRGYWWVKWVERVEVVDGPWWAQPPVPLQ